MQTNQTDLARLLVGTKVFVVPQFQRHYKWKTPQWKELWDDIVEQYDSDDVASGRLTKDEGHFLGSIVLHPAPGPASTVSRYWVIDGQQRLTTLLVLIAVLRDIRALRQQGWDTNTYTNQYLANQYNQDDPHRLVPGANDRSDFERTVYRGDPTGQIGQAYNWFKRQLEGRLDEEKLDFDRMEKAVLLRLLLVEINTSDDDNINQIFNTINHSGMRLSAIDLIRNHSFMQFDAADAGQVYEHTWKPMEDRLGESTLAQYLWAQLVRTNSKATQRDLYAPFQAHLAATARRKALTMPDATRFELNRLLSEVDNFLIATSPAAAVAAQLADPLKRVLRELQDWGSQTYLPMALEVLARVAEKRTSTEEGAEALRLVLAYLVRRGVAGIPSNNLNRILSSLPYAVSASEDLVGAVLKELGSSGKYWPRDAELRERGPATPIYRTLQPRQIVYILGELNDQMSPKEHVLRDELEVEHILPQELSRAWLEMLAANDVSVELAESRTHVIGNLTITGSNEHLARRSPEEKAGILHESNLPLNRQFPSQRSWTPEAIDRRSELLVGQVITRWPMGQLIHSDPEATSAPDDAPSRIDLTLLLDAMPADSCAEVSVLAEALAVAESDVIKALTATSYPLFNQAGTKVVGGFSEMAASDAEHADRLSAAQLIEFAQALGSGELE
jgi:hypothetical protein